MFRIMWLLAISTTAQSSLFGQPTITAVVNSASFRNGLPPGGALATIFVSGLTALIPGTYVATSQALPRSLGGVTVSINNDFAPLLAVIVPADPSTSVQVNFQVPMSANASLLYEYFGAGPSYGGYLSVSDGVHTALQSGTGNLPEWGGFFGDSDGFAIALHASNLSLVTDQNPAQPGESIIAYADGFFLDWPPPPIAVPASQEVVYQPDYSLEASPGNLYLQTYPNPSSTCAPSPGPCAGSLPNTPPLAINFMRLASGSVGIEEVSFVIPSSQKAGNWALFFNRCTSPALPGSCGGESGDSSPYVLLPVN
jgi:uncharacterized protein (TIGR03437 family)